MLGLLLTMTFAQSTPPVITLWPNGAPGSEARKNEPETKPNPWSVGHIYNPSLTIYAPAPGKANGTAVIIAPGGGHRELVVGEEGTKPAEYLAKLGVTAFVLKYRLAREEGSGLTLDKDNRADAFRAMRLVRSRAGEWKLDPKKIGMIGFSAGGETLSYAAFGPAPQIEKPDAIDALDGTPSFGVWIYPGPVGIPTGEIPKTSPPAFFLVSQDDNHTGAVMDLVKKYQAAKMPYELHILNGGGHGFNMGNRSKLVAVNTWPQRLVDWMTDLGYIKLGGGS